MITSHCDLMSYYRMNFALAQHHKYSLSDIENLLPFERDIYIAMLLEFIETQKAKQQAQA